MVGTRSRSRSGERHNAPQVAAAQQGNLASVLNDHQLMPSQQLRQEETQAPPPGSLTINVPGKSSIANQEEANEDTERGERSLTLGSEFDLGYILGKERGLSISGLLTPLGEPIIDGTMSEGTHTTATTGSTASTHHNMGTGAEHYDDTGQQQHLSQVPEHTTPLHNNTTQSSTTTAATSDNNIPAINHGHGTRSRGDSTASFLNGLYPTTAQAQSSSNNSMISHTPPTQMGTSYENSHFGKRMRAGSISGRLRSASDLEDTGMISREQKAILKDLLIAGDSSVQAAIDKYETGDPTALEEMIKSGALLAGRADVDLLGDLDLDFLNVHGGDDNMMFGGNVDDIGGDKHNSNSTAKQPDSVQQQHMGGQQRSATGGDGIGELEFNADFTTNSTTAVGPQHQVRHQTYVKARGYSIDDIGVNNRTRSNSLALPGMLLDGVNPDEVSSVGFEQWMDTHVAGGGSGSAAQHKQQSNDANGILNILNASQFSGDVEVLMGGKTASTLTQLEEKKKTAKPKKERKKYTKKDKSEPRERKSQAKMKGMMANMNNAGGGDEEEENKEVPSGLGRPRSMSDPNLAVRLDGYGLLHVDGPEGWVGAYSPTSRHLRVNRFLEKRNQRTWTKKVKYNVRKNFADSRLRVKGRFVKKEDEMLMRELMSLT